MKQHCSHVGGPPTGSSMAKVQEDFKARPPRVLIFEQMVKGNEEANGHIDVMPGYGVTPRLKPVSGPGILSLVLNIMCAALNLVRGIHLMEYTFQDDYEGMWNVIAFFLAFVCCICQCHLYLFYALLKKTKAFILLFLIIVCNLFLYGLRNSWQLIFHISVASLSTYLILSRGLLERTIDSGV